MLICNNFANNNKKDIYDIKSANLLTHTVLRCHRNIPAEDNEEIMSLPSPSAFQTTT